MPTPIITDGSMDRLIKAPKVVLPAGSRLFADRAARMQSIAAADDSGAYLRFLGHVCRGQCQALDARRSQHVSERDITNSRDHGMPPLSAHVLVRDAMWLDDLGDILAHVEQSMPDTNPQLTQVIQGLKASLKSDRTSLESLADRLISGEVSAEDAARVPFVGAALQVYFSRMAATLSAEDVSSCDVATVCPCCGMRPTASIVRIDPDRLNYRYLACSLCLTEWNMERVRCSSCESEKDVAYLSLDAEGRPLADAAARAEVCDECKTYLKLFLQEKDPGVDPIADDLNTLALDMLVDDKGYARTGPNLLFHPGAS